MVVTRRRLLFAITWLNDASIILLIFAVTRRLAEYGYGLVYLGVLGGAFSLAVSLSSIVAGSLSDRLGRAVVTRIGLAITLSGLLLCAVLPFDTWYFVLGYALAAVGPGFVYPPVIAWLNETARSGKSPNGAVSRAVLFFCLSWNMGLITGQITAGTVFGVNPRAPIYVSVFLIATNLLLLTVAHPRGAVEHSASQIDPSLHKNKARVRGRSGVLTPDTARLVGWIANIGGAFSVSLVLHLFSDLAVYLSVPADLHGMLLAGMRVVVIGTYITLHVTRFWHYRVYPQMMVQALGLLGLFILTQANGAGGLFLGLSSLAVLIGYNYFAGLFYGNEHPSKRGRGFASGMHQGSLAAGLAIGSIGGGILGAYLGPRSPYFLGMLVLLASIAGQVLVIQQSRLRMNSLVDELADGSGRKR